MRQSHNFPVMILISLIQSSFSLIPDSELNHLSFRIDGDRLNIFIPPDFESKSSYQLHLRATDLNGSFADTQIELYVNDLNESPIAITSSSNEIGFDAGVGATVSLFSTLDPDLGDIFKYSFGSETDSVVLDNFSLQGDRLSLLTEASLLPQTEFIIPIQVTDQDGLFLLQDFTFDVEPEPTRLELSRQAFSEFSEINSTLALISVLGPESYRDFTFSLVATSDQSISTAFEIDDAYLKLLEPLDYEQSSQQFVTIRAEDDEGFALETTLELGILDENEPPSELSLSTLSISEDLPIRSVVATFASDDQDSDDVLTYSLIDDDFITDNRFFYVVGNQLRSRKRFDFEQQSTYQIRAQVSDQLGQSFVEDITLSVMDVNDPPYALSLTPTEFSESEPAASPIALIEVDDQDHDDVFSFSLVTGFGDRDNDLFSVTIISLLSMSTLILSRMILTSYVYRLPIQVVCR